MNMNDIMNAIKSLAASQGYYGRLYRALVEIKEYEPEKYEQIAEELEKQHFAGPVDMVLYFEC